MEGSNKNSPATGPPTLAILFPEFDLLLTLLCFTLVSSWRYRLHNMKGLPQWQHFHKQKNPTRSPVLVAEVGLSSTTGIGLPKKNCISCRNNIIILGMNSGKNLLHIHKGSIPAAYTLKLLLRTVTTDMARGRNSHKLTR